MARLSSTLPWFRQDLRLADNPALAAAACWWPHRSPAGLAGDLVARSHRRAVAEPAA